MEVEDRPPRQRPQALIRLTLSAPRRSRTRVARPWAARAVAARSRFQARHPEHPDQWPPGRMLGKPETKVSVTALVVADAFAGFSSVASLPREEGGLRAVAIPCLA